MMSEKRFNRKLNKIKKRGERYKKEKKLRDSYAKYLPEAKNRKVSNIMLVVIVIAIVGYVVADFILQYNTGIEISTTITTCWFSFWGVELFSLAGIKITKVIKEPSNIDVVSTSEIVNNENAREI